MFLEIGINFKFTHQQYLAEIIFLLTYNLTSYKIGYEQYIIYIPCIHMQPLNAILLVKAAFSLQGLK